MILMTVSNDDFEKLRKNRANFEETLVDWLGTHEGAHSTHKIVAAMECSYANCYIALSRLLKNDVLEAAYVGRTKVWRLKK